MLASNPFDTFAAAAPPAGGQAKGPPVPPRAAKGAPKERRPWVWHGPGWYPYGGGPPPEDVREAPRPADPLALLREQLGDCHELTALSAKLAAKEQPAEAPRRPPLLEEE
eukprot:5420324-Pyramimonas_sp.AAC.1